MEALRLSIAILTSVFLGWNILYLIPFKRNKLYFLEKIFISYGLGFGFLSLEMLLFYFFDIRFNLVRITTPWLALLVVNLAIYFKDGKNIRIKPIKIKDESNRTLKIFLILGITFEILYALFRALIKPIESYDAIAIYAIKAKIFYLAKSIPADFFSNLALHFPHPDYPLNIPLSETLVYLFLGNLNDQLVKILFPLYFIGILVMLYYAIRRFASNNYSLIFTFLLASVPQFNAYATNGYLDLPLAYYYFLSTLFLFRWFKNEDEIQFLLLSAVMVSLSAWTKNEGLMYCAINIILILIFFMLEHKMTRRELSCLAVYIGMILIIQLPWLWVKWAAHLANSDIGPIDIDSFNLAKLLHKAGSIVYEFQRQIFGPKKWNILWPLVLFILISNYKKAFSKEQRYITISLSLTVLGYIFFYMVSQVEIDYFLRKTWSRFLIHFLPIIIYWLANISKEDITI